DHHEVAHDVDETPGLRVVLTDDGLADALESEGAQGVPLVLLRPDGPADLGDLEVRHGQAPCPARARSMPAGATSSMGRPRRAATSSGRCSPLSAATVAWTTLIALSDPSDLHRMSLTPAHSSTARAAPPAITPVPGEAGRSSTTPAASSP